MRKLIGLIVAIMMVFGSKVWGQECRLEQAEIFRIDVLGDYSPILIDSQEGFLVARQSRESMNVQRFDRFGNKIGEVVHLDSSPSAIAIDSEGNFITTYVGNDKHYEIDCPCGPGHPPNPECPDEPTPCPIPPDVFDISFGVYIQMFNSKGEKITDEILVNSYTKGDQWFPDIAVDGKGNFVIVWSSAYYYDVYEFNQRICGQKFNNHGEKIGGEFLVDDYLSPDKHFTRVGMDALGNFVVVWLDLSGDVYVQKFNKDGNKIGGKILVSPTKRSEYNHINLAMDKNGDFIVLFLKATSLFNPRCGLGDPNCGSICVQQFDANLNRIGEEILVADYDFMTNASVAIGPGGNFIVTWVDRKDPKVSGLSDEVYAKIFNQDGDLLVDKFRVDKTLKKRDSILSHVTFDLLGNFLVVWGSSEEWPWGAEIGQEAFARGFGFSCTTCTNGVQDGDETGVDCGGSCPSCPRCDDGIKNGEEIGIDCGGPDCPPCSQLEVYDPVVDSWLKAGNPAALFKPEFGTAVIVHGANPSDEVELPDWTLKMAQAISQRQAGKMNLLAWNWMEEAKGNGAGKNMMDQTQQLTIVLVETFRKVGYEITQPVHLMGHSLGAHLVAWCGSVLIQPEIGSYRVSQVTLWDPPIPKEVKFMYDAIISDIVIPVTYTRQHSQEYTGFDTYTELYDGPFNFGIHNVHLWIDTPNKIYEPYFGHDVYKWYLDTIYNDPIIHDEHSQIITGKTIGYSTTDPAKQPDPTCNRYCEAETIVFQYTRWQVRGGYFKQEKDCGNCESVIPETTAEYLIDGETITGDGQAVIDGNSFRFWLENPEHKRQKEPGLSLVCAFPVAIANWDYVSFDYEFPADSQPATLTFSIRIDGKTYPAILVRPSSLFSKGSSALLPLNFFASQVVEFVFELISDYPGVAVQLQNLTLSQDARRKNQPPIADAGPDAVYELGPEGMAEVTLSATGSIDPEGGHLWCRWLFGESYWDDGPEIIFGLPAGIFTFTLQVTDEFGATAMDEVKITVNPVPNSFLRGDANRDNDINIADPIRILNYLFGDEEVTCLDAADPNDSGGIDIADAIYLLSFIFGNGMSPRPPFPKAGFDLTLDELGCEH